MASEEVYIEVQEFPPKVGDVLNDFVLGERLKSSRDCVVHVCHNLTDSSLKFVTKIAIRGEANKLANEIKCYEDLAGGEGIPKLIYHKRFVRQSWIQVKEEWVETEWSMIVIEKLCQKFNKTTSRTTKSTLSLEELVPIAIQQILLLEFIHSRGLVHKGIKPDNFVMSEDDSKVYIIDFNKSKRYVLSDGSHTPFQKDYRLPKGLPLFHSVNYHKGIKCSRRDDMQSLGYCWIYLLKGELPWSHLRSGGYWPDYVKGIGKYKDNTTIEELCKGLPQNSSKYFVKYFQICEKLSFIEEPNYEVMRQLMTSCLNDSNNNQTN